MAWIKDVTINGERVAIDVDSAGIFSAEFADQRYSGKTLGELNETLEKAVKKQQQQGVVPVTILGRIPAEKKRSYGFEDGPFTDGAGVVHAKLRSKHAREYDTFLLVSDDGHKFKYRGRHSGVIARRLTADEVEHWMVLRRQRDEAELELEKFQESVMVNPTEALEGAVRK